MKDDKPMTILRNSMHSIREIGKQVLVEGVETIEMESSLRKIGCDYLQGYLFARPMPEEDLIRFLS
jgi:EAL domain-containing protein (putative c-di-GMP-specific phosphodiesterase class I)